MTVLKLLALLVALPLSSCVTGGTQQNSFLAEPRELDPSVCDPHTAVHSVDITNPYFPLPVGRLLVLAGEEAGTEVRLEFQVLDQIEVVRSVKTRVVSETEYRDGQLYERSYNYFTQNLAGDVCYFGEAVSFYGDGRVTSTAGSWRAERDNMPGIQMPAKPNRNTQFSQESAPGIAEDKSVIRELGLAVTTPAGELKYFAPGVGLIRDETLTLVEFVANDAP